MTASANCDVFLSIGTSTVVYPAASLPYEALRAGERAIRINPKFVRALIELARLYRAINRCDEATSRLEQAIASGAEYADVYCLLGELYHDRGETGRAREAYRRALLLNERYEAAQQALAKLSASQA